MTATARINVSLDGVGEAKAGADKVRSAIDGIGAAARKNSQDFSSMKLSIDGVGVAAMGIGAAMVGMAANVDRASRSLLGLQDIDITSAKRRYEELDTMIAQLAVTGGRSIGQLKDQMRDLAQTKHVAELAVTQSYGGVYAATGNATASAAVQPALLDEMNRQNATGSDSVSQARAAAIQKFGAQAINNMGVRTNDDMKNLFGLVQRNAAANGYRGGDVQLMQSLANLNLGAMSRNTNPAELIGMVARVGANLPPAQAAEKAQNVIGQLVGLDTNTLMRTLTPSESKGILDDQFRINPVKAYPALQKHYKRRFKTPAAQIGAMIHEIPGSLGLASSLFDTPAGDFDEMTAPFPNKPRVPTAEERLFMDAETKRQQKENADRWEQGRAERQRRGMEWGGLINQLGAPNMTPDSDARRRQRQQADDANFETDVGERAQRVEDDFKQHLSPGARQIVNAIPGAPTVAAGISALRVELGAGSARTIGKEVREGVRDALNEHSRRTPDPGPRAHVERQQLLPPGN